MDIADLPSELRVAPATREDFLAVRAVVQTLLDPLAGHVVAGLGEFDLVLQPGDAGVRALRLTPTAGGVDMVMDAGAAPWRPGEVEWPNPPRLVWLSVPPGASRQTRVVYNYLDYAERGTRWLDPTGNLSFAGYLGEIGWPHLVAAWRLAHPGRRAVAALRTNEAAYAVPYLWSGYWGVTPAERWVRSLLGIRRATDWSLNHGQDAGASTAEQAAFEQRQVAWWQPDLAAAVCMLVVSDLPELSWQVAKMLAPTFEGPPDELVAAALAATSAPSR